MELAENPITLPNSSFPERPGFAGAQPGVVRPHNGEWGASPLPHGAIVSFCCPPPLGFCQMFVMPEASSMHHPPHATPQFFDPLLFFLYCTLWINY